MWWLTLAFGACDRAYWVQPQYEACNIEGVKAWCYPTAAATLLAHYKHEWGSGHTLDYPHTNGEVNFTGCAKSEAVNKNATFTANTPWGDYMYHGTASAGLNLGTLMQTSGSGTNLTNGEIGLRAFLAMFTTNAEVRTIYKTGNMNDTAFLNSHADKLPFLVHIAPSCAHSAVNNPDGDNLPKTFAITSTNPANDALGSTLGHTAVVYSKNGTKWHVASNSPHERQNPSVRSCDGAFYNFPIDTCITGITTVTFTDSDPASVGLIITIVAVMVIFMALLLATAFN
jgi:hypothetical protein